MDIKHLSNFFAKFSLARLPGTPKEIPQIHFQLKMWVMVSFCNGFVKNSNIDFQKIVFKPDTIKKKNSQNC